MFTSDGGSKALAAAYEREALSLASDGEISRPLASLLVSDREKTVQALYGFLETSS
jgi:hypothetical protein